MAVMKKKWWCVECIIQIGLFLGRAPVGCPKCRKADTLELAVFSPTAAWQMINGRKWCSND